MHPVNKLLCQDIPWKWSRATLSDWSHSPQRSFNPVSKIIYKLEKRLRLRSWFLEYVSFLLTCMMLWHSWQTTSLLLNLWAQEGSPTSCCCTSPKVGSEILRLQLWSPVSSNWWTWQSWWLVSSTASWCQTCRIQNGINCLQHLLDLVYLRKLPSSPLLQAWGDCSLECIAVIGVLITEFLTSYLS